MNTPRDTLFYDGRCPLCSKEISTLRRLQGGGLEFVDIHQPDDGSDRQLPSREQLLRRLHLLTGSGDWVIGLPANVRAWSHTRYGFLFKPLLWPGIYGVARTVYERWADRRYEQKYQCSVRQSSNQS